MDIKYNNTTILSFEPKGKETRELMSECFVETSFASSTLHTLKAGYYIDVDSKRYWLKEDYKPRKDPQTGGYVYELRFYGLESILADHICFFITPTSEEVNWTLTGTLTQIGQVIADNIERAGLGTFTILGSEVIASISGNESSILDVLNDVVNKWGVEWWFEGSVLKFGECKGVDAVDFVVGDVIKDYTEENSMDSDFATRLYAFGSTKNITSDYRNTGTIVGMVERRLRMPVAVGDYIDIPNATRVVEKVKIYEECYPHRVGTLSAAYKVGSFWRFKDSASPFNPLTEPIVKADGSAGNKISVIFESGDLAGREFELLFFADNGEYVYEVVAKNEGDNIDLSVPNDTLHPNIGDTYSLFGMVMPASFITLEESNLQTKATADLTKMYSDKSNYSCPTNGVYCRANNKKYYIGQNVNLTRHDGTIINTRIRKVERDLYDTFDCNYTLGNKQRYSLYNDLNEKIERPLTLKQIQSSITTIIEDGAITQSERASLSMALKQFESEFLAVDAAFDVVYANTYLTAEVKADLLSKFNTYSSKYTALVNTINGAITDDIITQTERSAIDTGFAEYNAAYAALSTSVESAKKSVTDSIGTTLSAWTADGVISPLEKIAIKQTRTQITSEKEALLADADIYAIDDTNYATAWAAYDAVLVKYSADAPENIPVEDDFLTSETNYKTEKVALRTAITSAQKADTGEKHPKEGSPDLDMTVKNLVAVGSVAFYGGTGGGSTPASSLLNLSDIDSSLATAAVGSPLVKLANGKWGPGSVSIDLTNYFTKEESDARFAFKSHSHDYVAPSAFNAHTGDTTKHITSAERVAWNAKESALGNPDADGKILASTAGGVRSWVNRYVLPMAAAAMLGGVMIGANINVDAQGRISVAAPYSHPATHPASMIDESATRRFLTDAERANWNDSYDKRHTHGNKANLDSINQNLSQTSNVKFNDVIADGSVGFYGGVGSGSTPVASLLDLSDIDASISAAATGTPLVKLANGKWGAGSVSIDLSNYYNKSDADARYAFKSHSHDYVTTSVFNGHTHNGTYAFLAGSANQAFSASVFSGSGLAIGGGTLRQDATLHITGSTGGYGRLTQMSPLGASQDALNLIASTDASSADQWWSWGVRANGNYELSASSGFGANGMSLTRMGAATFSSTVSASSFISNGNAVIHSGNIGSQSVANATTWNNLSIALATYVSGIVPSALVYNSTNGRVEFGTWEQYKSWLSLGSMAYEAASNYATTTTFYNLTSTLSSSYLPYWNATTGKLENSALSLSTVSVRIGNQRNTYAFDVEGEIYSNTRFYCGRVNNNTFVLNSAGSYLGTIQNDGSDTWSLGYASTLSTLGTSVLGWNSSGNVGIRNTSPNATLHIGSGTGSLHYYSGADGTLLIHGAGGGRTQLELLSPNSSMRMINQVVQGYGHGLSYINGHVFVDLSPNYEYLIGFSTAQGYRFAVNGPTYFNGALAISGAFTGATTVVASSYIQAAYYKLGTWEIKENASGELEFIQSGVLKFKGTAAGLISQGELGFYS